MTTRTFEYGIAWIEYSRRIIPRLIRGGASERTILFAKNTSGRKPEVTAHRLHDLRLDLIIILGLQYSVTEPFSRFCD
jgi:predicted transcriptional regulator